MGFHRLQRDILLPALSPARRAILHFDAITYHGTAWLNGTRLGEMGPYVPHEFDLTPHAIAGNNLLALDIVDIAAGPDGEGVAETKVGVHDGWEAYGGIIRDAHIEIRPSAFIDNLRFSYTLAGDYHEAACRARIHVVADQPEQGTIHLVLDDGTRAVATLAQTLAIPAGTSETDMSFTVPTPALWSPESPTCYRISARLVADSGVDEFSCVTGFRSFVVRGNTFELNGKPVVLKGVCRHDMWRDQGFTLTREQMEQDMTRIKALGANFVRLVHYPHHRYVVELADKIGLMVSEEPGFWQVDFAAVPRAVIDVGLRALERTIRRDWNSPSVVAWLLANECWNTAKYIIEGKALCQSLDAWLRPVSHAGPFAHLEFEGMDFITAHPYTHDLAYFQREVEKHGVERPMVFTEWGGKAAGFPQKTDALRWDTVDHFLDLIESGKLAGHCLWSWQDMPQFTRIDAEMCEGILESGVVTQDRKEKTDSVAILARLFQQTRKEPSRPTCVPPGEPPWLANSRFVPVSMQSLAESEMGGKSWRHLEEMMAAHWEHSGCFAAGQWKRTGERLLLWEVPGVRIGDADFVTPKVGHHIRPIAVSPALPELDIPIGMPGRRIHILGNVMLPTGYPANGRLGETVGRYTVHYAGGGKKDVPLRNGHEVAAANLISAATRTNPTAIHAPRILTFVKDAAREHYQFLLYSIPIDGRNVERLSIRLESPDSCLVTLAVSIEV